MHLSFWEVSDFIYVYILYKSYVKGMSLSMERCGLDLFNIGMETLKPWYLTGVANFLNQRDDFKLVGFLFLLSLKYAQKFSRLNSLFLIISLIIHRSQF